MLRTYLTVLSVLVLAALLPAQSQVDREIASELDKLFEYKDSKGIERLLQKNPDYPAAAIRYYQGLRVSIWGGKSELEEKAQLLEAAWKKAFDDSPALDHVARWVSSQDQGSYDQYVKATQNQYKAWDYYVTETGKDNTVRSPFEQAQQALMKVAQQLEMTGHKIDAAEAWNFVGICMSKIPERSVQDRRDTVFALEQFVKYREDWGYTCDQYYVQNKNYLKSQKEEVERVEKEQAERREAGYSDDVKGVEAYLMPDVAEATQDMRFEMLREHDAELDYSQRGGPLPQYWWDIVFGTDVTDQKINWFRRTDLHLLKDGPTKYFVSTMPSDPSRRQEVEVRSRPEPSAFHLDADGKVPYAMFFWVGSDQERVGEAQLNLTPSQDNTTVFYTSAASWKVDVAGTEVTLYDDNTSGLPMDPDLWEGKFPMHDMGQERIDTPLMDSMRVGKGDRVPFSGFVKIGDTWRYLRRTEDNRVGHRPCNPAFFATGKVELDWKGPKTSQPEQLVIQGRGDFQTAVFDVAGGKAVEVPAGEYTVIWGRLQQGKGARIMAAQLLAGPDSEKFAVEPGKTTTLTMGAPFVIEFERGGSDEKVRIDATKIVVRESSGCIIGRMHACAVVPDVMAAKSDTGKGAKKIGKFMKFTDAELVNKAAQKYRDLGLRVACFPLPAGNNDGDMVLVEDVPGEGMKIGLTMKKHPLFGKIDSEWK